ncbi:hypothetical protein MOB39_21440 [Bacillus spizizenii]|nr:hypothetical protein [Bacillus spizizenii]
MEQSRAQINREINKFYEELDKGYPQTVDVAMRRLLFILNAINERTVECKMNKSDVKEKGNKKEEENEESLTKELGDRLLELYKRLFIDEYSPTIPQEKVNQELIRIVDKLVKHVAYLEEELDKYGKR